MLSTIGCSADPPLSPLAFQYAEAALGVCTRRAANAVPPLLQRIDTAVKQQELTEREAQPLREILTSAETQQWEQATRAARALLNRQAQARTLP